MFALFTNVGGNNVCLSKCICVCVWMYTGMSKYSWFNSQRSPCYWDQFVICKPFTDYHIYKPFFLPLSLSANNQEMTFRENLQDAW